jgi:hypothetical protein
MNAPKPARVLAPALLALAALCGVARADLALSPDADVDNTAKIQAALDAVPPFGNLVLPAGRYRVDGPVWLNRDDVGVVGDLAGTTLWNRTHKPMLAVGLDQPGPACWVPVAGLDPSLPGPRVGLDLSRAAVLLHGTAAEVGPPKDGAHNPTFWSGVRQVTLALLYRQDRPVPGGGCVLYDAGPLMAYLGAADAPTVNVIVRTEGGWRGWTAPLPAALTKVRGLAFTADLDARTAEAWIDGAPLALKPMPGRDWPPAPVPPLAFEGNEPVIGKPAGNPAPVATLVGFRLAAVADRPDPTSPHAWYCTPRSGKDVAVFTPPAAATPTLDFRCVAPPAANNMPQSGLLVPTGWASKANHAAGRVAIERIRFEGAPGYGTALFLGTVLDFRADRLAFQAGHAGIAQPLGPPSYPLAIERCRFLNASYAAVRLGWSTNRLRDIAIAGTGRHALTFLGAGDVADLVVGEGSTTTDVIRCFGDAEGTRLVLRDALINYEAYSPERIVHVTQGPTWATATPYVALARVTANNSRRAPILLDGTIPGAAAWQSGTLTLEHALDGTYGLPALLEQSATPAWSVQEIGPHAPGVPPLPAPKPAPPGTAPATASPRRPRRAA